MSDGLDDLLGDNGSGAGDSQPKGGGLRAQLEAVLAERKALAEQLNRLQAAQRQRDLDGLFEKYKIPALAKDFFPADADPGDDKAAAAFVEKYGPLWGATAPDTVTPPADQAATAAMQQATAQATSPALKPLTQDEYKAQFDKATSMADLRQMMEQVGAMQI